MGLFSSSSKSTTNLQDDRAVADNGGISITDAGNTLGFTTYNSDSSMTNSGNTFVDGGLVSAGLSMFDGATSAIVGLLGNLKASEQANTDRLGMMLDANAGLLDGVLSLSDKTMQSAQTVVSSAADLQKTVDTPASQNLAIWAIGAVVVGFVIMRFAK